jgi:hypothetical protein
LNRIHLAGERAAKVGLGLRPQKTQAFLPERGRKGFAATIVGVARTQIENLPGAGQQSREQRRLSIDLRREQFAATQGIEACALVLREQGRRVETSGELSVDQAQDEQGIETPRPGPLRTQNLHCILALDRTCGHHESLDGGKDGRYRERRSTIFHHGKLAEGDDGRLDRGIRSHVVFRLS